MKLVDFWNSEAILPDIKANDKVGVIRELVASLNQEIDKAVSEEDLVRVLLEREKLGTTGIGHGIAIPHGKAPWVNQMLGVFGRSKVGVEFNSVDDKPVHLLFLLIAPEASEREHLKALARITRIFRRDVTRNKLKKAKNKKDIANLLIEEDNLI